MRKRQLSQKESIKGKRYQKGGKDEKKEDKRQSGGRKWKGKGKDDDMKDFSKMIIGAQPIQKLKTCTIETATMGALYTVDKSTIGVYEWMEFRKKLTLFPKAKFIPGIPKWKQPRPVPYNLHGEDKEHYTMPPQFGLTHIGVPGTDLQFEGAPFGVETKFTAKLWGKGDVFNQQEVMDHAMKVYKETGRGGIMSVPTSGGKTIMEIFRIWKIGRKALIIVPLGVLIDQWIDRIKTFLPGLRVGVLRRNRMEIGEKYDITIGMLQSIVKRKYPIEIYKDIGLVCFDEVHYLAARSFWKCLLQLARIKVIDGLSATVARTDGMERLFWNFMPLIWQADPRTASSSITDVCVSVFKCGAQEIKYYEDSEKISPAATMLALAMDPLRNQYILQQLQDDLDYIGPIGQKHSILLISPRTEHCELLYKECKRKWPNLKIAHFSQTTSDAERLLIRTTFHHIVIATDKMAGTGLDISTLTCLYIALPLKNIMQLVGRLRCSSAKFDENTMRLKIRDIMDPFYCYAKQFNARKSQYQIKAFQFEPYKIIDSPEDMTGNGGSRQTTLPFQIIRKKDTDREDLETAPQIDYDWDADEDAGEN